MTKGRGGGLLFSLRKDFPTNQIQPGLGPAALGSNEPPVLRRSSERGREILTFLIPIEKGGHCTQNREKNKATIRSWVAAEGAELERQHGVVGTGLCWLWPPLLQV